MARSKDRAHGNAPEGAVHVHGGIDEGGESSRTIVWLRDTLQRAPWWAVSVVAHLIVLLLAAMIGIAGKVEAPDKPRIGITVSPLKSAAPSLPMGRPSSEVDRTPIPIRELDESAIDVSIFDPTAEPSDRNESADDDPRRSAREITIRATARAACATSRARIRRPATRGRPRARANASCRASERR